MDNNEIPDSALAKNALDSIPQTKSDAKDIVGLVKESGRITGYQLSDGSTVSKEEGVALAKDGEIRGVGIAHRKDTEYLKSIPDETENNNLSSLPSVTPEYKTSWQDNASLIKARGLYARRRVPGVLPIRPCSIRPGKAITVFPFPFCLIHGTIRRIKQIHKLTSVLRAPGNPYAHG